MRHAVHRALPLLLLLPLAPAFASEGPDSDALKALAADGLALAHARLSLQGSESPVERHFAFRRVELGTDATGRFDLYRYGLMPFSQEASDSASLEAELQLKRYHTGGVTLASLDCNGPALSGKNGLQVTMSLPRYARGMAIQRYGPTMTGPSFASDYRQLSESNVMILWQRMEDDDYHLLVPLASDGMVAEIGTHGLQFGVTLSGQMPLTPHRVPLFAFATGDDPYRLTQETYKAARSESKTISPLRMEKAYPEIFRSLGWSAYPDTISEADVLRSARSLKTKKLPVGFMLVDDGRLSSPHGRDWLTSVLRWEYDVPSVGGWQALQEPDQPSIRRQASNLVRTSSDFVPEAPWTNKEHVFQNAYNAFWASNLAYPDYASFQSHLPQAEYQAIARAVSGGPIYIADAAGQENAELLGRLMLSTGRLLMLDAPGLVTRDTLLVDTGLVPVPLKIAGGIQRPGLTTAMVGAFNVNKSAKEVQGHLRAADVEGLALGPVAVYERGSQRVRVLEGQAELSVTLGEYGAELYTMSPIVENVAVFGLLDKYLGPAAVQEVRREGRELVVRLEEKGEFGAYVRHMPRSVRIGNRILPARAYRYKNRLLRIPSTSFRAGEEPTVHLTL